MTSGIGIGFVMQSLLFTANGFVRRLAPNGIRASQDGGHLLDLREEDFSPGREAVSTTEIAAFVPNCVFIPASAVCKAFISVFLTVYQNLGSILVAPGAVLSTDSY